MTESAAPTKQRPMNAKKTRATRINIVVVVHGSGCDREVVVVGDVSCGAAVKISDDGSAGRLGAVVVLRLAYVGGRSAEGIVEGLSYLKSIVDVDESDFPERFVFAPLCGASHNERELRTPSCRGEVTIGRRQARDASEAGRDRCDVSDSRLASFPLSFRS